MRYKCAEPERVRDVRELVIRASKLFGNKIAFKELTRDKQIVEYAYTQLEQDRNALGARLLDLDMDGYHFALISENRIAWVLSYLTIVGGVGVVVPLDKELLAENIAALLKSSDSDVIVCSETYLPMVVSILDECPDIKSVIVMNPSKAYLQKRRNVTFYDLPTLVAQGRKLLLQGNRAYQEQQIDPESMCEILFTSGTTGPNKGVMLSHKNLLADLYGFMHYIKVMPVSISVLPIHHSFESTCHMLGILFTGNTLCFNDSLKHMMENLMRFKPGMSLMVPLFLETMYKRIWQEAKREELDAHLRYGIWFSNFLRVFGIDGRRLFFKPILDKFGGELKQIVCGGAPLRTELIKKFDEIGINVINGYGITECAPVISTNATDWKVHGTVGKVLPGCNVRIADPDKSGNGEIQVKSDIVMMGYYKDEVNTKAVFTDDGYFMTGDMGRLSRTNFLYITGRKKNLIILSNGKNICPEELEEAVAGVMPYVKEVMVYAASAGEQELINADVFLDVQYIADNGISDVQERLNQDIRKLNNSLPVYKRINNVNIMEHEFEKTTTKKIKRQVEMKRREYNDGLCAQENT